MDPTTHPIERAAPDTTVRWGSGEAAERYVGSRWRSARARGRDVRLVRSLLARLETATGGERDTEQVLDVPSGTGRLRALLSGLGLRYVAVDASLAMLSRDAPALGLARGGEETARALQASVHELPFRDGSFEVVVCCRLLHHLERERDLAGAVRELVRVSRRAVIASFWDAASLHAWRRRRGLRGHRPHDTRVAIAKQRLVETFREAGAEVTAFRHSFRFVSQQTFLLARKRRSS